MSSKLTFLAPQLTGTGVVTTVVNAATQDGEGGCTTAITALNIETP